MTRNLLRKVEDSIQLICAAREDDGQILLSVPVQYPSGALAMVEISGGNESVWVSDRGLGFFEAELMSAETSFPNIARKEAELRGVSFDGRSIFAVNVPVGNLAAGVVAVSNASVRAAAEAVRVEQEKVITTITTKVYDQVRAAFPHADITRQMDIDGSRISWAVHNVVKLSDRIGVFEPTTNHTNSISAKYLMFSDLSSREGTSLSAVVSNPQKLDAKGQMLRDVANIIGIEDEIEKFQMAMA